MRRTFTVTVSNGMLSISPAAGTTLNCTSSTFYQDFIISGPVSGTLTNWTINWQGSDPGGFEIISTGDTTARFRKYGTSTAGSGYLFTVSAEDSNCSSNSFTSSGYYLNVSGDGTAVPYYYGMVAEWHFDECTWYGSAGEILDSSGNGYNGQSHNISETDDGPEREAGQTCKAAALNLGTTTNQYVSLDNTAVDGLSDFSVSLWCRVEALSSELSTLLSGANSGQSNAMLIYFLSATSMRTHLGDDGNTSTFTLGSSVDDGVWHHVVWTREGATQNIYIDGTLEDTETGPSATISVDTGGLLLGQEQDAVGGGFVTNQIFQGWIDEVRIYNRALSASEVTTLNLLTHSCKGTCYTNAAAWYRMDEDSWTHSPGDVQDFYGGYNATSYGAAAIIVDDPGDADDTHMCNAGQFPGAADDYILATGLPVSTTAGDKTTITFWMKWGGQVTRCPLAGRQATAFS